MIDTDDRQSAHDESLSYLSGLMSEATPKRRGDGGSAGRKAKHRLRPLIQRCGGCGRRQASSIKTGNAVVVVCQSCGTILGEPKPDRKGPARFARIPPEYKSLGLPLADVLEFLIVTKRWRNGDLREWEDAFDYGRQHADERDHNRGGRPRDFGRWRGEKVQGRLPKSLEAKLRAGGVRFERPSNFTAAVVMALDLYAEALMLLHRDTLDTALRSSPDECQALIELFLSSDIDDVVQPLTATQQCMIY